MKFVYVFDEEAKRQMEAAGLTLLKADADRSVYIFCWNGDLAFAGDEISYILSDTMTF